MLTTEPTSAQRTKKCSLRLRIRVTLNGTGIKGHSIRCDFLYMKKWWAFSRRHVGINWKWNQYRDYEMLVHEMLEEQAKH